MKTRPNKTIKKASTAIRRGMKIAQENGITVARGALFRTNKDGDISCACAIGMGLIGLYGTKRTTTNLTEDYFISKTVPFSKKYTAGTCLRKILKIREDLDYVASVIMHANDASKKSPEEIADALEACGL